MRRVRWLVGTAPGGNDGQRSGTRRETSPPATYTQDCPGKLGGEHAVLQDHDENVPLDMRFKIVLECSYPPELAIQRSPCWDDPR